MIPPKILSRAAPNFPRLAKDMNFESTRDHTVRLKVTVDERGRPSAVAVLEGIPGMYGFNEEAIAAAKLSTYAAATKGGIAQRETIEIVYVFKARR